MSMASLLRRGLALRRWPQRPPETAIAAAVHPRSHRGGGAMARDVSVLVHVAVRPASAIAAANVVAASRLRMLHRGVRNGAAVWDMRPMGLVKAPLRDAPGSIRLMSSRQGFISFNDCQCLGEMINMAHDNLNTLDDRSLSAVWTELSKHLRRRNIRLLEESRTQLDDILCRTLEVMQSKIDSFSPRDLAQTAIALARVMKSIEDREDRQGGRLQKGSPHQLLHSVFIGDQSLNKQFIMKELARAAIPMREEFEPRQLSNVIYAFGLARYALQFDDGRTTFDVLAEEASSNFDSFNGQDFSNMLWAYANANASNPALFKASGEAIVAIDSLESFWSQALANMLWAYTTAKEPHPELFKKVAEHIVRLDSLESFNKQDLSNIVWAYATGEDSHPKLFKKVADHIVAVDIRSFNGQDCSNTVWAYATADESHPRMFEKVADHIVRLDSLQSFKPQELSNTVWAYAKAKETHPKLFKKVAEAAIQRQSELNAQDIANLLWAYASNGETHTHLFDAFSSLAAALIGECNEQNLANVAWAYAVADVDAPTLFNDDFVDACVEKEGEFPTKALRQLHQWNLWQEDLKSSVRLPPTLAKKCHDEFVSEEPTPSALQDDVVSVLSSIGLQPQEEFLTKQGYRLDALVEVDGRKTGIEVDGPTHFVGRKPTGSTLLKQRQVAALDEIPVVSVPYWEWNKLGKTGKNREKKQKYLRSLLRLN